MCFDTGRASSLENCKYEDGGDGGDDDDDDDDGDDNNDADGDDDDDDDDGDDDASPASASIRPHSPVQDDVVQPDPPLLPPGRPGPHTLMVLWYHMGLKVSGFQGLTVSSPHVLGRPKKLIQSVSVHTS